MPVIWLCSAVVMLAAAALGSRAAVAPGRHRDALWAAVAWSVVVAIATAGLHDPGVSIGSLVAGVVLAVALIGVLPFAVYYGLGRLLGTRRVWLGALWLITLLPLFEYVLFAYLIAGGLVFCPPDRYECRV